MNIYLIWSYNKWPHGPFSCSFPIMTFRLLFPTWLLPTMTLAIICRNGSEPFARTLLTMLTACLYHPSSSILHSLHFALAFIHGHLPPLAFFYLLFPLALIHPHPLSSPFMSLLLLHLCNNVKYDKAQNYFEYDV